MLFEFRELMKGINEEVDNCMSVYNCGSQKGTRSQIIGRFCRTAEASANATNTWVSDGDVALQTGRLPGWTAAPGREKRE